MTTRFTIPLVVAVLCVAALGGCSRVDPGNSPSVGINKPLRIGYVAGPMAAPLYVAEAKELNVQDRTFKLIPFKTSGDIGYGLLSGELDAGLIEPDKALSLFKEYKKSGLKVAGVIEFPYGASLVLRRGLKLRLNDLSGRTIAAEEPDCVLVRQFKHDLKRFGIDPGKIKFVFMPFEEMIPALEAKKVDGAITKSSYALIGESLGHTVLYQNWKAKPGGDECCPAFLAQVDYFLVVRPLENSTIGRLTESLAAAGREKPAETRVIINSHTRIPAAILDKFPVPSFSPVSEELKLHLKEFA